MKPVLCVVLAFLLCGLFAAPAQADGIITHSLIADKALEDPSLDPQLKALLLKNPGIVRYGSMFPDWAMAAGIFGGASVGEGDVTHDFDASKAAYGPGGYFNPSATPKPVFRTALTAQLLPAARRTNPTPEALKHDEQALAFLFGVIAHQQADGPWHLKPAEDGQLGYERWAAEKLIDDLSVDIAVPPIARGLFDWIAGPVHVSSVFTDTVKDGIGSAVEGYLDARLMSSGQVKEPAFIVPVPEVLEAYRAISPTIASAIAPSLPKATDYQLAHYLALKTGSGPLRALEAPLTGILRLYKASGWFIDALEGIERGLPGGELEKHLNEISAPMPTYATGGMVDGAKYTVNGWEWTWDRMMAYTPGTVSTFATSEGKTPPDARGWYYKPVTVYLGSYVTDTFDDMYTYGPLTTWYSLDGKGYQPYVGPINFTTEGVHTIKYYTADRNGIVEQPHMETVKVDLTPAVVAACSSPAAYTRSGPGAGGNIITSVTPPNSWVKIYRWEGEGWFDVNPNGYGPIDANGYLKLDGMIADPKYGTAGHPYRAELWANGQVIVAVGDTKAGQPEFRVFPNADSYTPWSCPQ